MAVAEADRALRIPTVEILVREQAGAPSVVFNRPRQDVDGSSRRPTTADALVDAFCAEAKDVRAVLAPLVPARALEQSRRVLRSRLEQSRWSERLLELRDRRSRRRETRESLEAVVARYRPPLVVIDDDALSEEDAVPRQRRRWPAHWPKFEEKRDADEEALEGLEGDDVAQAVERYAEALTSVKEDEAARRATTTKKKRRILELVFARNTKFCRSAAAMVRFMARDDTLCPVLLETGAVAYLLEGLSTDDAPSLAHGLFALEMLLRFGGLLAFRLSGRAKTSDATAADLAVRAASCHPRDPDVHEGAAALLHRLSCRAGHVAFAPENTRTSLLDTLRHHAGDAHVHHEAHGALAALDALASISALRLSGTDSSSKAAAASRRHPPAKGATTTAGGPTTTAGGPPPPPLAVGGEPLS